MKASGKLLSILITLAEIFVLWPVVGLVSGGLLFVIAMNLHSDEFGHYTLFLFKEGAVFGTTIGLLLGAPSRIYLIGSKRRYQHIFMAWLATMGGGVLGGILLNVGGAMIFGVLAYCVTLAITRHRERSVNSGTHCANSPRRAAGGQD